jgi:hypothetical protein
VSIEVVIPSLRQASTERLVSSLVLQTVAPDVITIVSNETQPFPVPGSRVRLLRFSSDTYSIGEWDVALRQNVGIYATECDTLIIQGDDQIAPPSMVEDALRVMEGKDYIWGNHRLTDYADRSLDEIRLADKESGVSRESPAPPAWHGYQSCYGGMFAAKTDFIRDFGGFDMGLNNRHSNEDQQLGYRLMKRAGEEKVLIEEPPFSWHGIELKQGDTRAREPWLEPIRNGCVPGSHETVRAIIGGAIFLECQRCPYLAFADGPQMLFREQVLIRYRSKAVNTSSLWL